MMGVVTGRTLLLGEEECFPTPPPPLEDDGDAKVKANPRIFFMMIIKE